MKITHEIERLLARYETLNSERIRHKKMAATLEADEAALSQTTDLDDKAQFQHLSVIRLKRDMVPRKIKEFTEAAADAKAELEGECGRTTAALLKIIGEKIDALSAGMHLALSPFFPARSKELSEAQRLVADAQMFAVVDATTIAAGIVYRSAPGATLHTSLDRLTNDGLKNTDASHRAKELIEIAARIEAVKV